MRSKLIPVALLALLASCSGGAYQRVPFPPQDVEVSSPTVARVYVLRMKQPRGAFRTVLVEDNDREIGRIESDNYLCWERPAERTLLTFLFEGGALEGKSEGLFDLECEAGQTYYLGLRMERAWNKPAVRLLDRDEARSLIEDMTATPTK